MKVLDSFQGKQFWAAEYLQGKLTVKICNKPLVWICIWWMRKESTNFVELCDGQLSEQLLQPLATLCKVKQEFSIYLSSCSSNVGFDRSFMYMFSFSLPNVKHTSCYIKYVWPGIANL